MAQSIYEEVRLLAQEKRALYAVNSSRLGLQTIRNIYKAEGISIHYYPKRLRNLRAAYFNDDEGCDVLLNKDLPDEAKIFSLAHELKHHYLDRNIIPKSIICSLQYSNEPLIEKTAEVFAAEFVWPEQEFIRSAAEYGISAENCTPQLIVCFKRQINIPISYTFLVKRLEWFKIIRKGQFDKIQFKKLEWSIFGKPFYLRGQQTRNSINQIRS